MGRPLTHSERWHQFLNAAPDLGLAAVCLITWLAPPTFGDRFVAHIMLVMLLEFIIVHSSGFMGQTLLAKGSRADRMKGMLGFGVFYTLFVAGFALAFHTWWPIVAFWGLTANRLLAVLMGWVPAGKARDYVRRGWAAGALYYIGGVMLTTLLPVPRLGITRDVVRSLALPGEGLWIDQPHRVVAFGFLYFLARGISELYEHRWLQSGLPPE
jgi:hypothetical protein